ncbi:hypothetical protein [Trinickia dinghuensis]|uniref:Uncharacterized protein n=1 Tax=Trinickia dinghuensis TaxID=2291023 RepID=A0A3D8K1X4_9BURK|nr:hypothetical protein [Trinickia dinghuensis]RDU99140.1 hypothetical protein DWV00_08400 [Trinickia dinghuensis]
MSQSSERLVVFVTPAQKRVLTARAASMGISLSELVRRAVLAFDETGQEVRAAGLVDRLGAASEASRKSDTLRRLAQGQAQAPAQAEPRERAAAAPGGTPRKSGGAPSHGADPSDPAADSPAALPVAAAVARALVAQEAAQADERLDAETEALVARVIHPAPGGSV